MSMSNHSGNNSYTPFGPMDIFKDPKIFEDPLIVKLLTSMIMIIFMVVGIVGNICVCAVVIRDKTMRTPTNFYLVNLALTDFMLALFVPGEIFFLWEPSQFPFGGIGCRIHLFLFDLFSTCSVFTIVAFTVERYVVVTRPFYRQRLLMKSRVLKIIILIWITSWLLSGPNIFYYDSIKQDAGICCYMRVTYFLVIFFTLDVILLFVVPMTVICVLYLLIAVKLRDAHKEATVIVYGNQSRVKAVKMLAAVAGLFFYAWAPYTAFRCLVIVNKFKSVEYYVLWRIFYYFALLSVYFSSAGNPVLYSLMSQKFRRAFKDLLKRPNLSSRLETTERAESNYTSAF